MENFENIKNKAIETKQRIFIIFVIILEIIVIEWSLFLPEWVKSENWTGGILRISSGDFIGKYYYLLGCSINCKISLIYNSGFACIILDGISSISLIIGLFLISYELTKSENFIKLKQTIIILVPFFSNWLGILIWVLTFDITFKGNVEEIGFGAKINAFGCILHSILVIFYFFFTKSPNDEDIPKEVFKIVIIPPIEIEIPTVGSIHNEP